MPAGTILNKIVEMCAEMDDNAIPIHDLCPPGTVRGRSVRTLYSLLGESKYNGLMLFAKCL